MVRSLKIVFAAVVAFWGLIGAFGNFAALSQTYDYVEMVTSMVSFVEADRATPPWRTSNPLIVWAGVALIILGKVGAFIFCAIGAAKMLLARTESQRLFNDAKSWAVVGCGCAVLMLFGGFIVVGETMYLMWAFPDGESSGAGAWRYGGFIALIMIFIAQPEPMKS